MVLLLVVLYLTYFNVHCNVWPAVILRLLIGGNSMVFLHFETNSELNLI